VVGGNGIEKDCSGLSDFSSLFLLKLSRKLAAFTDRTALHSAGQPVQSYCATMREEKQRDGWYDVIKFFGGSTRISTPVDRPEELMG